MKTRIVLARRPWIPWIAAGSAALAAAAFVQSQVAATERERQAWGNGVEVWVASVAVEPGTSLDRAGLQRRRLPVAALPDDAVGTNSVPVGPAARALRSGDVLTRRDVGEGDPRFSLVPPGHVVVSVTVPGSTPPALAGDAVQLAVSVDGTVVAIVGRLIKQDARGWSVAIPADRAALVAAATANGIEAVGVVLCPPGACSDVGGVQ